MPGITVEELLGQVLPAGTAVVAGRLGLEREVTWAATLRTRPPAFPHLKGGEIALISTEAMRLLEPELQLGTVVRSLAGLGVAAVAVAGDISEDAQDLADSIGLPLLALPGAGHLPDLEQAIARAIVDHRTTMHQRSQEIYRRLTELAIEGRGVDAILEMLADLTEKEVVLEDQHFALRSQVGGTLGGKPTSRDLLNADAERVAIWVDRVPMSASDPPTLRLALDADHARIVAPIAVKDTVLGFLSVIGRRSVLGELDELAASRGAAACAIELARERAVIEAEDRFQTDFVEAIVTGSFTSPEALATRAARLSFDLTGTYAAVVFASADALNGSSPLGRTSRLALSPRRLRSAVEREVSRQALRAPSGTHGDRVVLLLPGSGAAAALKTAAEELRESLSREIDAPVSAGLGRPHSGLEGIRQTFQEADGALTVGGRVLGPGRVAYFADLGIYRLLLALRSTVELEAFYQEALGRLVEYDRKTDGELVRTLDAYFACLGSPTDAAERLHVHRNTLLYRLHRIQEIAGIDLSDAETRLTLHLALRAGEVLHGPGSAVHTAQLSAGQVRAPRT